RGSRGRYERVTIFGFQSNIPVRRRRRVSPLRPLPPTQSLEGFGFRSVFPASSVLHRGRTPNSVGGSASRRRERRHRANRIPRQSNIPRVLSASARQPADLRERVPPKIARLIAQPTPLRRSHRHFPNASYHD